jgi:hypothetical protein
MNNVLLIVRVLTAWESLLTGGVLLGLYSLVRQITVFEKRPGVYYRGPVKFSESPGAGKSAGEKGAKKSQKQRKA